MAIWLHFDLKGQRITSLGTGETDNIEQDLIQEKKGHKGPAVFCPDVAKGLDVTYQVYYDQPVGIVRF